VAGVAVREKAKKKAVGAAAAFGLGGKKEWKPASDFDGEK
jgi:hypothetical protein